jgi:hypothetical protein
MTRSFTEQEAKEIAEQLDCGFRVFCHKTTNELIFIPNTVNYPTMDMDAFEEENEKLDKYFTAYIEIEAMESKDSFQVMADFAEQLTDKKLQRKLYNALNKRNPFREFKFIIDNSGEQRQRWFDFKTSRYKDWVTRQLNRS